MLQASPLLKKHNFVGRLFRAFRNFLHAFTLVRMAVVRIDVLKSVWQETKILKRIFLISMWVSLGEMKTF